MLSKQALEKYLTTNGVAPTAPDQEIKQILLSAKWNKDDVDTALMVLREDKNTHETHIDSLHKVFHSDERLKPDTISALLGVDVEMETEPERRRNQGITAKAMLVMLLFALLFSGLGVVAAMWYLKVGFFFGG